MSQESLISYLSGLRTSADGAEAAFLMALVAVDRTGAWKKTALMGELTFADWLEKNHLCKPSRYANWRQATEVLDPDVMQRIGVHAAIQLGGVQDEKQRQAVQELMIETATRNRMPLSNQNAVRKVEQICGSRPRLVTQQAIIATLHAELRAARSRIVELESELARIRAHGVGPPRRRVKANLEA